MKSKKQFFLGMLTGVVCALVIAGLVFGIVSSNTSSNGASTIFNTETDEYGDETLNITKISKKIQLLEQMIDESFILDYNKADLEEGIYKGLVSALGDEYSVYYTAEEAKAFQETATGSYCGIGATISENSETGEISIIKVFADSPAEKAGVLEGDVVIGIDGESVSGLSSDEVVKLVRGEEGTTFTLNINRGGVRYDIDITRAYVYVQQASYSMIDDTTGYIAINQVVGTAATETAAAVKSLKSQGMTKLVIDMRNNLGGTLDVLLDLADIFLNEGEVIIKEVDKQGNTSTRSATKASSFDGEISILVNGYTASAAEVFTAALHDNGHASVVGTKTFGKGIVQNSFQLSGGSIIKLTTEYYYTPNDVCIHKIGITPDYVIEYDAEAAYDNQLAKALEVLR